MFEGEYTDNNGIDTWWYKNGNQAAVLPIVDGRKEGLVFIWNEDGSKKQSGYFNENKNTNWEDWLKFDTVFDKPGKQGVVGLMKLTNKKEKDILIKRVENLEKKNQQI